MKARVRVELLEARSRQEKRPSQSGEVAVVHLLMRLPQAELKYKKPNGACKKQWRATSFVGVVPDGSGVPVRYALHIELDKCKYSSYQQGVLVELHE
jgi:hypothetical protein